MKKTFFLSVLALFMGFFSLSLISCGGDDEDDLSNVPNNSDWSGGDIEINGVKYKTTLAVVFEGSINPIGFGERGMFSVTVLNKVGNTTDCWYEVFTFSQSRMPKEGDDFADMSLALTPFDELNGIKSIIDLNEAFEYVSGSAQVVKMDKGHDKMTVRFDKLKMSNGDFNYTFNGTVTVDFNFYR